MRYAGPHRGSNDREKLPAAAANGLIDRRALFRAGTIIAGAAGTVLAVPFANAAAAVRISLE